MLSLIHTRQRCHRTEAEEFFAQQRSAAPVLGLLTLAPIACVASVVFSLLAA